MGKGNGTTRASASSAPNGLNSNTGGGMNEEQAREILTREVTRANGWGEDIISAYKEYQSPGIQMVRVFAISDEQDGSNAYFSASIADTLQVEKYEKEEIDRDLNKRQFKTASEAMRYVDNVAKKYNERFRR